MLEPVPSAEFFERRVGQEYLERFASSGHIHDQLYTEWVEAPSDEVYVFPDGSTQPVHRKIQQAASLELIATRKEKLAKWLTGNYDPSTNTCTLYRGVDNQRAIDARTSAAINSRLVSSLGQGSMLKSVATLNNILAGVVESHVVEAASKIYHSGTEAAMILGQERVGADDSYQLLMEWQEQQIIDQKTHAQALIVGNMGSAYREEIEQVLALQRRAMQLGKIGYLAAREAAEQDIVPPPKHDIANLFHSYIHLTTDIDFIKKYGGNYLRHDMSDEYVEVQFTPGSLAVAPALGYVDGEFYVPTTPDFVYPGSEYEWYGIGQLASGNDVQVSTKLVSEL